MLLPSNRKVNWDELGLGAWCLVLGAWWSTIIALNVDRENGTGTTSAPVQN
jgi:hypothetical protein